MQVNLLHCSPFLLFAGNNAPAVSQVWKSVWLESNLGKQNTSSQSNPLSEKSYKCFCQQEGV